MKDSIAAFHRFFHPMGVTNVTGKNVQVVAEIPRRMIQPTPGVEGVVKHEGADTMALANKGFGEMGAYEAISSGDEKIHCDSFLKFLAITTTFPQFAPVPTAAGRQSWRSECRLAWCSVP